MGSSTQRPQKIYFFPIVSFLSFFFSRKMSVKSYGSFSLQRSESCIYCPSSPENSARPAPQFAVTHTEKSTNSPYRNLFPSTRSNANRSVGKNLPRAIILLFLPLGSLFTFLDFLLVAFFRFRRQCVIVAVAWGRYQLVGHR